MSINFEKPISNEVIAKIREMIPVVANDRKTFLTDTNVIDGKAMKIIANAAKQPAQVELHSLGEIKTLEDGTRYEVTPHGWRKVE